MEINIINASEQELIQAIRTNIKECKTTRSQIARLREVGQSASTKFHYEEQVVEEETEEDEDEDEDTLKDEVDFYYSSISDTPVEQLEKKNSYIITIKNFISLSRNYI